MNLRHSSRRQQTPPTSTHLTLHLAYSTTVLQTRNLSGIIAAHCYRPDALPAAQPTVSKHWQQKLNKYSKNAHWTTLDIIKKISANANKTISLTYSSLGTLCTTCIDINNIEPGICTSNCINKRRLFVQPTTTVLRPLYRITCIRQHHPPSQLRNRDFVGVNFYCLHALANGI